MIQIQSKLRHNCDIVVHKDKMAEAAPHYEQMEYFVGAEIFVPPVEDWEL